MNKKGKRYDAKLKVKVALELLIGKKSELELCSEYNVAKTSIYDWKNKLLAEAESIFIPEYEKNKQIKQLYKQIDNLHQLIAEVVVENSFLKKKLIP